MLLRLAGQATRSKVVNENSEEYPQFSQSKMRCSRISLKRERYRWVAKTVMPASTQPHGSCFSVHTFTPMEWRAVEFYWWFTPFLWSWILVCMSDNKPFERGFSFQVLHSISLCNMWHNSWHCIQLQFQQQWDHVQPVFLDFSRNICSLLL